MLQCDPDLDQRERFVADLNADNHKHKLHHVMSNARLNNSSLLGNDLYIDLDDAWENFTIKLVSAVTNCKQSVTLTKNFDLPILMYKNNGRLILLNYWENLNYFIFTFLTLFLLGIRGHFATYNIKQKTKISLET